MLSTICLIATMIIPCLIGDDCPFGQTKNVYGDCVSDEDEEFEEYEDYYIIGLRHIHGDSVSDEDEEYEESEENEEYHIVIDT